FELFFSISAKLSLGEPWAVPRSVKSEILKPAASVFPADYGAIGVKLPCVALPKSPLERMEEKAASSSPPCAGAGVAVIPDIFFGKTFEILKDTISDAIRAKIAMIKTTRA